MDVLADGAPPEVAGGEILLLCSHVGGQRPGELCPLRFGESYSLSVPGKGALQLSAGASSGFDGHMASATARVVNVHDGHFDPRNFAGLRRICARKWQQKTDDQ